MKAVNCCEKAEKFISYRKKDNFYGPENDGWAINVNPGDHTSAFENIDFCPFCGTKIAESNGMLNIREMHRIKEELDQNLFNINNNISERWNKLHRSCYCKIENWSIKEDMIEIIFFTGGYEGNFERIDKIPIKFFEMMDERYAVEEFKKYVEEKNKKERERYIDEKEKEEKKLLEKLKKKYGE